MQNETTSVADHADHAVCEPGSLRLRLRSDLIFVPHTSGSEAYYVVEDPLNSRFHRLGIAEYILVSLLDGRTSIREAFSHLSSVLPNHRLSETDATAICHWLVDMTLAHPAETTDASCPAPDRAEGPSRLTRWNPLMFRLPLGHPDRALERAAAGLGCLFGKASLAAWVILVTVGAYHLLTNSASFAASSRGIFAPTNWIWLAGCWLVLKLIHEMSHGIVCHRHGGWVREAGVQFVLFAPLAYVDVTSSWRFRSRWQRIHVAAAGMYSELLIAAVAGWCGITLRPAG